MNLEEKKLTRLVYMTSIFIIIFSLYLLLYSGFSLNNLMLVFFLIIPFFIILFGKIADIIMKIFNKVASRTLVFHDYRMFLPLFLYYLVLSIFMSFLMKNSLLFSEFALTDFEIAIIALSLAFLPRVIGFTAAHERTRIMLLSILTPLTTFSLPILILKWETVIFSLETVKYCLLGSLIFPSFGELWIWIAQRTKILVKFPEYQRPDFLAGVRAKPWEHDWMRFIEDFKDPDLEYVRPIIINAFRAGLKEAVAKNSSDLKLKILDALKSMDYSIKDSLKVLDLIKELAKEEDSKVRAATAIPLGKVAKYKPDEILPIIKELLKELANDEDSWMIQARVNTAGLLVAVAKTKPEEVLPILKEWAKDGDSTVRAAAAGPLGEVAKIKPEEVLPILKELAKDEFWEVRSVATKLLKEVAKSKPDEVLPILKELANDEGWKVRAAAAVSLGEVAKIKPEEVLPILKELANDEGWKVRAAAAVSLGEAAKSKPDEVLLLLKELANDVYSWVRAAAAESLKEVAKSKPDEVLSMLKEWAKDKYLWAQVDAARSLGEVAKSKPAEVLLLLKELANDEDGMVRVAAAESLGEVAKSKPDEVLSILKELANDEDGMVRATAAESLKEVAKSKPLLSIFKK